MNRPADSYALELPADLASLAAMADFLEDKGQALGLAQDVRHALGLAADEALTNVVSYAYQGGPGPVRVYLERRDDAAVLIIEDEGVEFDPADAHEPDLDSALEERPIGGLGLYFIQAMTDEVVRERSDGVNRLKMIKRLTPPDQSA